MHSALTSIVVCTGAILLASCATTPDEQATCEIVSFGTIPKMSEGRTMGYSDIDPTLKLGQVNETIAFETKTKMIQAKLGTAFGVMHKFSNIPARNRIDVVMTHPSIEYPEGSRTEGRWSKKPTDNGTSFTFDTVEEVVSGTWNFSFRYNDSELCSQSFVVDT